MTDKYTYDDGGIETNAIIMQLGPEKDEILKITRTGFYVRGVKVAQDDREAENVYTAFCEFLAWNRLQR